MGQLWGDIECKSLMVFPSLSSRGTAARCCSQWHLTPLSGGCTEEAPAADGVRARRLCACVCVCFGMLWLETIKLKTYLKSLWLNRSGTWPLGCCSVIILLMPFLFGAIQSHSGLNKLEWGNKWSSWTVIFCFMKWLIFKQIITLF